MAINSVKTIAEEKSFKFLSNQSSILRTVDTNNITYNGVNVIVDKPKAGDVMCVTLYKGADNNLLSYSQQKVVWIDGNTINSLALNELYNIAGICLGVKGNKAIVKYKYNIPCNKFSSAARHRLYFNNYLNGQQYNVNLTLPGTKWDGTNPDTFDFNCTDVKSLVNAFNNYFLDGMNFSAGLYIMEECDGLPILNCIYNDNLDLEKTYGVKFKIKPKNSSQYTNVSVSNYTCYPLRSSDHYYLNNDFKYPRSHTSLSGAACKARYSDYMQVKNDTSATVDNPTTKYAPATNMTSVDTVTANSSGQQYWYGYGAVTKPEFESNVNCRILRDTFANYDKYLDSKMIKVPCNSGGVIKEFPSGKESTNELSTYEYTFWNTDKDTIGIDDVHKNLLFPAIVDIKNLNVDAPGLTSGNWWVPSAAEMIEIMKDITYNTSFWDSKPDAINSTIKNINDTKKQEDRLIDYVDARYNYWTSSIFGYGNIYYYYGYAAIMAGEIPVSKKTNFYLMPITIYEL